MCEAPGAFICATHFYYNQRYNSSASHLLRSQWDWTALTLNPYYEGNDQAAMVDDDRFIIETLDRWYFGTDNSGNILNIDNIRGLWQRARVSCSTTMSEERHYTSLFLLLREYTRKKYWYLFCKINTPKPTA